MLRQKLPKRRTHALLYPKGYTVARKTEDKGREVQRSGER